jgi:hypothetical protein
MTIQGSTTIFQCKEDVRRAMSDFSSGDGMDPVGGGNECPGGVKDTGSTTITAQVVESNTKTGSVSTSEVSISVVDDGKELTRGSMRGNQGGNKTGASGYVSDRGASWKYRSTLSDRS